MTGTASRNVLRDALRSVRKPVALCVVAGLVWQAVAVTVPAVLEHAVDDGIIDGDRGALWRGAGVLAALGLLRWAGDAARHWWVERSGAVAAVELRARLCRHIQTLDDVVLGSLSHGQLVARATTDVDVIWVWLAGIATLITSSFTLMAVLASLASLGWTLAAVGAATVPLAALVSLRHVGRQRDAAAALAAASGRFVETIEDTLAGIRTVKGIGGEQAQFHRAGAASSRLQSAALSLARVDAGWVATSMAVPSAGIAAGLWVGGRQVVGGDLGPGALVAFAGWMALLVDAAQTLTERLTTRGEASAAAHRLAEVLALEPLVRSPRNPAPVVAGPLRVEAVSLVRGGHLLLDDVSFAVEPGQWLAVVGPSGAGKSSLLRLLARLAEPDAGSITLGGTNLRTVDLGELRRRVAWVPQAPVVVSGTLADNLRLAAPGATDEQLLGALEALDGDDVLDRLGGLGGRVGEGGLDLSGGQRQRIALARAALAQPAVISLDDPTSAVDPGHEALVLTGLRRLCPHAAAVVATHRWATALACDEVVFLDAGRVVERSTATQLASEGRARQLLAGVVP